MDHLQSIPHRGSHYTTRTNRLYFDNPSLSPKILFSLFQEYYEEKSDAAGELNKNITMLRFCSWLSKTLKVAITHLYPVRGHSFGQCDRNFGIMKSSIKKKETIETMKPYLENIITCRDNPSPFELVHDDSILLNWDKALIPYFEKTPKTKGDTFRIQKYCIIKFKSCGSIAVSQNYSSQIFQAFKFMITHSEQLTLERLPSKPLKAVKIKDITDLFPYLCQESRSFYQEIFESSQKTNDAIETQVENVNDNNTSDDDFDLEDDCVMD
ncbi:hypothetical protein J6590_083143 [Homalodisca vitripennis]|nr:hypothetical protein J6590_083143 [Homalodisca vitripennis]